MNRSIPAELEFGLADDGDVPQVLALANEVQPHAPWTAETFAWQFRQPPSGPALLFVARGAGRIVGLYCAVRGTLDAGGATVATARVQDVMTMPAWRGRGVLHALAERCRDWLLDEGIAGYAFPNEHSHRSFVRAGWDVATAVPWWRGGAAELGQTIDAAECDVFDERATEIWDAAKAGVAIRRDAAYLNWRYARPGQKYAKFLVGDETVLVLKRYNGSVHVCDVFAPAASRGAITHALRFAQQWAAQQGAQTVTAWLCPGHRDAPQFAEAGLVSQPDTGRYVVTLTTPGSCFYVSHSDNDIF